MMNRRAYITLDRFDPEEVTFSLGQDRQNKPAVSMSISQCAGEVALVSPPTMTMWPRCTGNGNFGTIFGPSDITKSKFSLDLTDCAFSESQENTGFTLLAAKMNTLDDKLLEFVFQNQLRLLARKNLSKDEIKMLQIRTVRPKYDKNTGALIGHSINLSTSKYAWDGMGGKMERKIHITDHSGKVITNGQVCPGDVVSATMYANQVYTGVGGDKFGIHWSFEDVAVIAQRARLEAKMTVPAFSDQTYDFAQEYQTPASNDFSNQFPD